ncbi:MAG TPA: hypothetical protein VFW38_04350 [Solirubrobacteraceae bacterium]|nr:hypothetical protein [Solirubrobacteraceae bacterium]
MSRGGERSGVPKPDDFPELMLGASLTVVWMLIADAVSAAEATFSSGSCLSIHDLYLFNIAALAIVVWLGSLATLDPAREMLTRFVAGAEAKEPPRGQEGASAREVSKRLGSAASNRWIPVTGEFVLAGWLIYRTGGTLASPYAPVPLVMMAVGQSLYHTPALRLRRDAGFSNVSILVWDVLLHYRYPIFLCTAAMVVPIALQAPAGRLAPEGMPIFTSLLGIVVCMCVMAGARWRDQR